MKKQPKGLIVLMQGSRKNITDCFEIDQARLRIGAVIKRIPYGGLYSVHGIYHDRGYTEVLVKALPKKKKEEYVKKQHENSSPERASS
jgi:hypothetical protein